MNEEILFSEALEIADPKARDTFLDTKCDGQPELRARLARLMRTYERTNGFLESSAQAEHPLPPAFLPVQPGTVLDRYRLLRLLGEGGMGTVYLAEQIEPVRRQVAVKVIKIGLESPQVLMRFDTERQTLALMDHPNIAKVLDAGATETGQPYFVMEWVDGVPLTDYCDIHRLHLEDRLELFFLICQAVHHAHQKGILHRDLKPSNILIAEQDGKPVPKIIDFGVAKAMGRSGLDQSLCSFVGMLVGTLEYMSPEQAHLSQQDIDTRTDVYSLGAILYELLTGSTPHTKTLLKVAAIDEALRIIREDEPPKPSTRLNHPLKETEAIAMHRDIEHRKLVRMVQGELDWIVMKCLEKDRNRRYESASALSADVQRYLNDESVLACPPSTLYRLGKTFRRHRGAFISVMLILLALLGGIIASSWGFFRATEAESLARSEVKLKEKALQEREEALSASQKSGQEARERLFQSLLSQAQARRFSRQMGQRLDSLDAVKEASAIRFDERLRDEATAAMALPDIRPVPSRMAFPHSTPCWDIDGEYRTYARAEEVGGISIRTVSDDREIRTIRTEPVICRLIHLSPDGTHVIRTENDNKLRMWRVSDGKEMLKAPPEQVIHHVFSPDGRQLIVTQSGILIRYDVTTGEERNRWPLPEKVNVFSLAFHPDHRKIAVGYFETNFVSLYDSANGKQLGQLSLGEKTQRSVAWHPDGKRLAIGTYQAIQIWDIQAERKLMDLQGHMQQVATLDFHPQGDLLASRSWDGDLRLWDVTTGKSLMRLPLMCHPHFSRDGRWLGTIQRGETAQLLEVTPAHEYRTLVSESWRGDNKTDLSPDGTLLAVDMGTSGVHVWNVSAGNRIAVLPAGIPLFHPSGQELLLFDQEGLHRHLISVGKDELGRTGLRIQLAPSRTMPLLTTPLSVARQGMGSLMAMVSEDKGMVWLIDLAKESLIIRSMQHRYVAYVAISPDGKWIATSGWHSLHVRLWNAETAELVHEWPLFQASIQFTPDSRTLVVGQGDAFGFYDVISGKLLLRQGREAGLYPGHVAFAPKMNLMAMEMAPGIVHLKEISTGKTVAKLEDPHGDRSSWLGFTSDESQLVVVAHHAQAIHVWNLRAIRQRLKSMKLDWDWPEYPIK